MTNQTIRTQITLHCNTIGFGVSFRGGSDAHLATVRGDHGRGEIIVSGKLAKVLDYMALVNA